MMRRALLALAVGAAAAGGLAASAQGASGTYQVLACNAAPGGANNSWVWSEHDVSGTHHYTRYASCPYVSGGSGGSTDQESGLSTTDTLGLSNGAPPGSSAGWTFTAAPNTTITAITYERYLGHANDPSNDWSPALRSEGTIVGETCEDTVTNGETCFVGGPPGRGATPGAVTGLSTHELSVSIVCEAPAEQHCVTGAEEHKAWAALYGATVTISDSHPPTLGTPSGSLWSEGEARGYHKGTESASVEANDLGGGVASIVLSADGTPVDSYQAACNYTEPQPCPLAPGPQTLTLNTTTLSDGTHTLSLVAVDAAGNRSTVASKQITVDNTPPGPPVGLTASPTTAGGSTFTASWSDPSGQVAPIASATYRLCPAGGGACGAAGAAPAAGPATVTAPGPGSWTLAVWLTDAAGNSSEANAAYTTLIVPEPSSSGSGEGGAGAGGGGSSGSGEGGSSGAGGGTGVGSGSGSGAGSGSASGGEAKLRVRARVHGRRLLVHVRGPQGRRIRVSFLARSHRRRIARGCKRVRLRDGRKLVTFPLPQRARRHGRIVVRVRLGHGEVIRSVLRGHAKHRAASS